MRSVLRLLLLVTPFALHFTCAEATRGQAAAPAPEARQTPPSSVQPAPPPPAGDNAQRGMTAAAWVALFGALLSGTFAGLAYKLSRTTAFRTATIESQKMLLEINKAYVAEPKLLALEGEYDASRVTDADFPAKLKAMAYMKLNVFELVFPVLPRGRGRDAWVTYFELSLRKSELLGEELEKNRAIYHHDLLRAYDAWKATAGSTKRGA